MRKHHLALGLGLVAAVCALPSLASAKPQTAQQQQESDLPGGASALRPPAKPRASTVPTPVSAHAPKGALRPLGWRAGTAVLAARAGAYTATAGAAAGSPANLASGPARAAAARARAQSKKKREPPPCFAAPVPLARTRGEEIEPHELSLTLCDGTPNPAALDSLSVLGRPRDVERPELAEIRAYQRLPVDRGPTDRRRDPAYVTPQVMRLHAGLLERLQKVAARYPGRTIEIVSGHRPEARETSRHHHGRALDFRVKGVTRERLRDFLRPFEATGVGYYPNSSFVHMDVRDDRGYWVDRSGPGEAADYGIWPPPRHEIQRAQNQLLAGALAELRALGRPDLESARPTPARAAVSTTRPAARRSEGLRDEGDRMSDAEVRRIRADTLKALEALR